VLSEQDLQAGDWIDWNVSVAVLGFDNVVAKALVNTIVRYDEKQFRRQSAYLRPCSIRSCIVEAFGTRGRLVFADFDSQFLELAPRLENCDAVVAVCDKSDGAQGAAACELAIRRANAVIDQNTNDSRRAQTEGESLPPRFIVLAGQNDADQKTHEADTCNNPKSLTHALQLTSAVEDLSSEIVTTSVADQASVDPFLHLLVWRLIKQSRVRRERLERTTGHRLLDSRVFWRGYSGQDYGQNVTSARRKSHSMS
jgi:hypothetical protein